VSAKVAETPDGGAGEACVTMAEFRAFRLAAEQTLADARARHRVMAEMSSDYYWETDAEHRIKRTDQFRKWGHAFDTSVGMHRWEFTGIASPDAAGWKAHRGVLDARQPFRNFEFSRLSTDGVQRHFSISGDPVFDLCGAFAGYRGLGTDTTMRKATEKALRDSEARYQAELERTVVERTRELLRVNAKLIDERAQRIQLERAMLTVAESERSRIGRELHDDLGQVLTAAACMAQALSQDLESRWAPGAAQASAVEVHLSHAVEKARLLAQGLMPLASQVGSISVALEQLARHARESYQIDVRVVCDPAQIIEDRRVAQELYRVAQEAVLNAVKHGRASMVTIEFSVHEPGPKPRMLVIDNGDGIDAAKMAGTTGIGLRIMRQRCRSIGLELALAPHPAGGAQLRVE
jgi:signal transduction histidine kinase